MIAVKEKKEMNDDSRKEWEKCFDQMDKFDGYMNESRKYGFTLITGLTTASSFLGFSDAANSIQLGVIIVTMVLVDVLYLIDTYYQLLLSTALLRSQDIEKEDTPKGLGHNLVKTYDRKIMSYVMFSIYLGFLIALGVLGYYVINAAESQTNNQNTLPITLVEAANVQQGGDFRSALSETAYLWIPLAVTTSVTIALLVIIFRAEQKHREHIAAARKIIKDYETKEENKIIGKAWNIIGKYKNPNIKMNDEEKNLIIEAEEEIKNYNPMTYDPKKREEVKGLNEGEELKMKEENMKIVRESMKVIREREILDALEGKGRTQEGGKS
jgi:hypothetical protein